MPAELHTVSRRFAGAGTAESVAELLVAAASDLFGLPGAIVYLHDPDEGTPHSGALDPVAHAEDVPSPVGDPVLLDDDPDANPVAAAFASGETVQFEDASADSRHADADPWRGRTLVVPLGDHGVLVAGDHEVGRFDDRTVELAETLAADARAALDRVDREAGLRRRVRELERYEHIVESLDVGVYTTDGDGTIVLVNEALAELTGYSGEELAGSPASRLHDDAIDRRIREGCGADADGAVVRHDLPCADGGCVPVETRFGRLPAEDGGSGRLFVVRDATRQVERERRLRRRRSRLDALADLYALVGDVYAAAVRQSTRESVERLVCERLADSDAYELAWIAALDRTDDGVTVRERAGVEALLDDLDVDAIASAGDGPTGRALRTQELQVERVVADADESSAGEWTAWAARHGLRAAASAPVVHEGTLYGVLTLYSDRSDAFDDRERGVVAGLGEFVGHALAGIERKAALTSDDLVELELRLPGMMDAVLDGGRMEGRVEIDRTVPTGDGSFVQYATTTPDAVEGFEALLSALPHVEAFARVADRDGEVRYRIEQSDPPLMSIVAGQGGLVRGSVIEDGDFDMYVDLPQGADVRSVVEALQAEYPDVELVAQRRAVHREDPREAARRALSEELTERQRTALEVAYYAGFFNWPRDTTAEELAETMSITSPTLHHHLRKALGKVLAAIFERGPVDRDVLT